MSYNPRVINYQTNINISKTTTQNNQPNTYDKNKRVTAITTITQSGVLNHTTLFNYNNDFQLTNSTYAGVTAKYSYDKDGLLTSSGAYTITRDSANGYTTQLTDNTITQNRSYNNYAELTELSDNIFTYQITNRDKSGAITQKIESINNDTKSYDYSYDDMGRLVEVKLNSIIVEEYSYDNNGNRASATINGVNTTGNYTLDDSLELYGDNAYRYSEDGYLIEKITPDGTTNYEYGTLGELKSVTSLSKTISYQHKCYKIIKHYFATDRGREVTSPPSEPCVRFSRTRLSS